MDEISSKLIAVVGEMPEGAERDALLARLKNEPLTEALVTEVTDFVKNGMAQYENTIVSTVMEADQEADRLMSVMRKQGDDDKLGQVRKDLAGM